MDVRSLRRFTIIRNYGGCHIDAVWFIVTDKIDPCSQLTRSPGFPSFYYSGTDQVSLSNGEIYKCNIMC